MHGISRTSLGRVLINDLISNTRPALVIGIAISKNEPKAITNRGGNQSYLLTFIIRDSPTSSIICNCWGSKDYSNTINSIFAIGNTVEIRNCQVKSAPENDNHLKFRPYTSSPFELVISEKGGTITSILNDASCFDHLMNIPVKQNYEIVKLSQVQQNIDQYQNQNIDLLVLFKRMKTPRQITTKIGKLLNTCEITVCDQTVSSFAVQLWDSELISFVQTWTERECVILLQDAKVSFNQFHKQIVGTASGKTIVTVNPDTREAHLLYLFAQSLAAEEINSNDINLDDIREVYTVENVIQKAIKLSNPNDEKFRGILYACLTGMDLDGPQSIISTLCKSCGRKLRENEIQCANQNCPAGKGSETTISTQQIEMPISLSDHSGTLKSCKLTGAVAEAFLGCTVNELIQMNETEKTMLKWKFLLERFKWHFQANYQISKQTIGIRILGGKKADIAEWCSKLSNY